MLAGFSSVPAAPFALVFIFSLLFSCKITLKTVFVPNSEESKDSKCFLCRGDSTLSLWMLCVEGKVSVKTSPLQERGEASSIKAWRTCRRCFLSSGRSSFSQNSCSSGPSSVRKPVGEDGGGVSGRNSGGDSDRNSAAGPELSRGAAAASIGVEASSAFAVWTGSRRRVSSGSAAALSVSAAAFSVSYFTFSAGSAVSAVFSVAAVFTGTAGAGTAGAGTAGGTGGWRAARGSRPPAAGVGA